jgi:hypothetical protein
VNCGRDGQNPSLPRSSSLGHQPAFAEPLGYPSRLTVVPGTGALRPKSLLARTLRPVAARQLLSVWNRAADVHRQRHGHAGNPGGAGSVRPAIPLRRSRRRSAASADWTTFTPPGRWHANGAEHMCRAGIGLSFPKMSSMVEAGSSSWTVRSKSSGKAPSFPPPLLLGWFW